MADAKAIGYLELRIDGFAQAVATAQKLLAGLAAAFAAFKVGEFFKDGIKDAINFGNEMYNASRKLGNFDPGNLLLVQKALEQAGRSTEEARNEIDSFISTGRNLSDIFHGTEGYAAALQQVSKQYGSQAKILSENAQKFSQVFDVLRSIGDKLRTFFLAMTAQFLKPLQNLLETLDKIDLASVGEQFGKYIAQAMNMLVGAIANGSLWEIVKTGLIVAAKEFSNYMEGIVNFLADGLWDVISVVVTGAFKLVTRLLGEINWGAILVGLIGILGKIGDFIIKTFLNAGAALAALIKTLLGDGDFSKNFDEMVQNQQGVREKLAGGSNLAGELVSSNAQAAGEAAQAAAKITGEEIKNTLAKIQVNFQKGTGQNAEGDIAKLNQLVKSALETAEKMQPEGKKKNDVRDTSTEPFKVIGDSLAKVGGGGGFIRASQNILEKEAVKQTRALDQSNKTLEAIEKKIGNSGQAVMQK